ncbi:hypothetical protein [Alkaliphilus transvaalensis]|uniref:hypothetical protein n=1 Tax=Alkaliphilus transvaalensis TaxID=114628 RepID=UPI00047A148C|nr:hypothetical protein [Alkaliphilus transvaalensis]
MNTTTILVIGTVIIILGLAIAYFYFKKQNLEKFYHQVFEQAKQVPKQKRNSFLLLMFKESLAASMKKSNKNSYANKFQNPKYLDIQLVQMSNILKDPSKVQDKVMKRALDLFKNYQTWEKAKLANDQKETQPKAS